MERVELERNYWNEAAFDKELDIKYISDVDTQECLEAIMPGIQGKYVLDIGCGVGRMMRALDAQDRGYWITGVDISPEILKVARSRPHSFRLKFVQSDGRTLPLPDESFQSAYCMLVFQHVEWETMAGYIKEAARVLKKNGLFHFQFIQRLPEEGDYEEANFSKWHHRQDVYDELTTSGFEILRTQTGLVHHQWSWITARRL